MKKQIANIITSCRILGSIGLLFCPVFSDGFYVLYLFCGLTDMVDGTIARKTNTASDFGARLDTVADIIFVAVCFVKILPLMELPVWLWIWIAVIAIMKTGSIVWGLVRDKKLISMHTMLNKVTGFLLFLLPLTFGFVEPVCSSAVVCFFATLAAIKDVHSCTSLTSKINKKTFEKPIDFIWIK